MPVAERRETPLHDLKVSDTAREGSVRSFPKTVSDTALNASTFAALRAVSDTNRHQQAQPFSSVQACCHAVYGMQLDVPSSQVEMGVFQK